MSQLFSATLILKSFAFSFFLSVTIINALPYWCWVKDSEKWLIEICDSFNGDSEEKKIESNEEQDNKFRIPSSTFKFFYLSHKIKTFFPMLFLSLFKPKILTPPPELS